MLNVQTIAGDILGLQGELLLRNDLFERLGNTKTTLSLREQLQHIRTTFADHKIPPKRIAPHPRLAPISAIHFDHYNSCVINFDAPDVDDDLEAVDKNQTRIAPISFPLSLGTCLNFMQDHAGNIYAFFGRTRIL